jgi:molecular chaperone DnaK (HSP70)
MISYAWTKLLLDRGTPLTKYDDSALEKASNVGIMQLPENKSPEDLVGEYLAKVYEHILKIIGKSITEETLQVTPIEFWFTVPAIWSDRAQRATRDAARRAGFAGTLHRPSDRLFLITEPEAAAIAVLSKYASSKLGGAVKVGKTIDSTTGLTGYS